MISWKDGGRPFVWLRSVLERARSSLFTVPVIWIAIAITVSQLATWLDVQLGDDSLPEFTDTTVGSARAILSAISSGTITAASVVFSLTLVAIQMSSSVYSPRVLRSFLRDRFQQHMIGLLLASFTFSLLVLREVRGPLDSSGSSGGDPYIPRLSVFLAVIFAVAAVLALLASISHTSQSLRSSAVAQRLVDELTDLVRRSYPERSSDDTIHDGGTGVDATAPASDVAGEPQARSTELGAVLTAMQRGWVQQVSLEAIRDVVEEGSTVSLHVAAGTYVFEGAPLLTLSPTPTGRDLEELSDDLRGAFAIGDQRTMQQDVAFGFTMIEDIAVKALSPGVNDPNTAIEVIEQLSGPVVEVLQRELHAVELDVDGCRFVRVAAATADDMVGAAFNQIRHFSRDQPAVQLALVRTLRAIGDELLRRRATGAGGLDALRSMLAYVRLDLARATTDPAAAAAHREYDAIEWLEPAG